jgi:peptide/nickel transport system permease protein
MTTLDTSETGPRWTDKLLMKDPKGALIPALLAFILLTILGTGIGVIFFTYLATLALLFLGGNIVLMVRESPVATIGFLLVFIWVLAATAAPIMPLLDPNAPSLALGKQLALKAEGSSPWFMVDGDIGAHLLGADNKGRDMLARLVFGAQKVLFWATLATVVAYVIGMLFGVMAGYLGGWWDEGISFVANVMLSFPIMVIYIVVITNFGASGVNIIFAVSFASAPGIMRIVRGLVLDLKTRDYIAAAQTRGESAFYIMIVELLPNARGPLIVDGCLRLGYTVIAIATLGFLGLGLPPPNPDWGSMLVEAKSYGAIMPHMVLIPAIALSSLILGFNLLADGLREMSLRD